MGINQGAISLDQKYTQSSGHVFLTGIQALVRLPMAQIRRDRASGLKTAGFVSGYRGSPLGGYDQQLFAARKHLEQYNIKFQPGVNEDLAATAIWGSQQLSLSPGAEYDGVVGLMRNGRGLCAVVVTGKAEHAAVLGRARGVAVPEHVAGAVDARALAVPDPDHPIVLGAGRETKLLRPPDCSRREILVHPGLESDVVFFEMLARGEQLLVIAAERRAAIAGDKSRGIETAGAIPADLRHGQADQCLDPGEKDVAGALGVFLVEADRTLIDSHPTLANAFGRLSSFYR